MATKNENANSNVTNIADKQAAQNAQQPEQGNKNGKEAVVKGLKWVGQRIVWVLIGGLTVGAIWGVTGKKDNRSNHSGESGATGELPPASDSGSDSGEGVSEG